MITEETATIIRDFCELNAKAGGICSEWCIGVTDNVERDLFEELGIPRDYCWCIHRCALSAKEARAIMLGFRNIGFETYSNGKESENESKIYVFAYRKAPAGVKDMVESSLRA
jgi:hypothetical protein